MSLLSSFLLAAITITTADRLAMADRQFNKGNFKDAITEYRAVYEQDKSALNDGLLYRLAECYRARDLKRNAIRFYEALLKNYPNSKFAEHSRLMLATLSEGEKRKMELIKLDSDSTSKPTRAAALYYLGTMENDEGKLRRCIELDPNGKYALYAKFRRATVLSKSNNPEERKESTQLLIDIAFGAEKTLVEDALYLASVNCYNEKDYVKASGLLQRYVNDYPQGKYRTEAVKCYAWCNYMQNSYADTIKICDLGESDDIAYLRGAAHYNLGENELARKYFADYLAKYSTGKYRSEAELAAARIDFNVAQKANDHKQMLDAAKRSTKLSNLAGDALRLGWAYERVGDMDSAENTYNELASKYPGTKEAAEAMFLKAMIALRSERYDTADIALKEALGGKLAENRVAEAKYWRGIASVKLDHVEEGVNLLKEALNGGISLDMTREAKLIIADSDFNSGRQEEAKKAYAELVKDGAASRMSSSKTLMIGKLVRSKECARALADAETPEWRQAGYALLGSIEEDESNFAAAKDAYLKAVAELVETDELPRVMLRLGVLQYNAGEYKNAKETLVKAVDLNKENVEARAEAYLTLAKVSLKLNNREEAEGYATVVSTLFDSTPFAVEANEILKEAK